MDAIKKKMQAMKVDKDNALIKAVKCETEAQEANARADKTEEEVRTLQKKFSKLRMIWIKSKSSLWQPIPNWMRKKKPSKT